MENQYFKSVNETLYHEELPNGLNVFLIPKKDYRGVCGVVASKFGSLQSNAVIEQNGKEIHAKKGVAHFLEHRMFDNKRGPVMDLFSAYGAMSNAFTTFDKTAYYFFATNEIDKCLDLLMDFVSELNISEAGVEKEKDIIVSELKMTLDQPDNIIYDGIFANLYKYHEIRNDVGGNEAEVRSTTREILSACHQTFYHPKNMVLVVVGDIDVEQCMRVIRKNQARKDYGVQNAYHFENQLEPTAVACAYSERVMPVTCQKIAIGYKHKPLDSNLSPKEANKYIMTLSMYLDLMFGESSVINAELYQHQVINAPLETLYMDGPDYLSSIIFADVLDYDKLVDTIDAKIDKPTFTKAEFERIKHMQMGFIIRCFDDVQSIAINFINNYFRGVNSLEDYEVLASITYEDVKAMAKLFEHRNRAIFTIKPAKEQKNG